MKKNKIIISGGGTGGHIYPGIAIGNCLKKFDPLNQILFVGAFGNMEMKKVPQAGFKIKGLWISGLNRKEWWKNFFLPIKIFVSLFQAFINIGVALNIFPVTGQTLPLLSSGGSAAWVTCIAFGIILSVSEERFNQGRIKQDKPVSNPLLIISEEE